MRVMVASIAKILVSLGLGWSLISQAVACDSSDYQTIQIGINWVNSECSRGRGSDCADVANSVIRTIRPLRNCPGVNPREVDQILQQLRSVARGTPAAAQREADRRYRDRMAPAPATRGARQADRNGCLTSGPATCAAQCMGSPYANCVSMCQGASSWRCN